MSMSLDEVSAVVSVLLGFAPPAMLPAPSSAKLNKLLLPKPFDRPRAVFLMQIDGSHEPLSVLQKEETEAPSNTATSCALKIRTTHSTKMKPSSTTSDERNKATTNSGVPTISTIINQKEALVTSGDKKDTTVPTSLLEPATAHLSVDIPQVPEVREILTSPRSEQVAVKQTKSCQPSKKNMFGSSRWRT
ncbi:hypothetical protein ZWY2020_059470 [Hordeum vulgare]|nr:hypothetical protein ZWY2020_059470 [Hordeum vulgare]